MTDIVDRPYYVMSIVLNQSEGDSFDKYFSLMEKAQELGIDKMDCAATWMETRK